MSSAVTSATATAVNNEELLFDVLPLTTSRMISGDIEYDDASSLSLFQYEALIAAISIFFFRITIHGNFWCGNPKNNNKGDNNNNNSMMEEPIWLRYFFAVMLAFLAYSKKSYEVIIAVEIFSYFVPWILYKQQQQQLAGTSPSTTTTTTAVLMTLVYIGGSALFSLLFTHHVATGTILHVLQIITPTMIQNMILYLFPIEEVTMAFDIIKTFAENNEIVYQQFYHLMFVTFHIQVGMGYLGIDFLRQEQQRRNQLIRITAEDTEDTTTTNKAQNCSSSSSKSTTDKEEKESAAKAEAARAATVDRARRFQRTAPTFILFAAIPYMAQLIFYGNINRFAFLCLNDDMHRLIRLDQLFNHDNHLIQMVTESTTSPEAYATSMTTVVGTTYDLFNRKLFSLPKVLLLPVVFSKQPMLLLQVFPFIFVSDWVKGKAVSYMTKKTEDLQKEMHELISIRTRIESFDLKNAELLQRSGIAGLSTADPDACSSSSNSQNAHQVFTKKRWQDLTIQIQKKTVVSDLIQRTKAFFNWVQRNFVFVVLIDCALAELLAFSRIMPSEVFVYARAVEDAVDTILMRSRSEAELARMITEIEKLQGLADIWDIENKNNPQNQTIAELSRNLLPCHLPPSGSDEEEHSHQGITLRNLHYSRGTAMVRADHAEIMPGIYALTGANGSGKSTLFRVLMSCSTNEKAIDLPASIVFSTPTDPLMEEDDVVRESSCEADVPPSDETQEEVVAVENSVDDTKKDDQLFHPKLSITMPSSHVVEISQTFYWPLYTKPIDWIYQEHITETLSADELQKRVLKVATELHSLSFFGGTSNDKVKVNGDDNNNEEDEMDAFEKDKLIFQKIQEDLLEEKEDWFNDLSGGQKSKVELVRKVFLQRECPRVLLIDETLAPLDPASKAMVMNKVKAFCDNGESIVIVIYHTDVKQDSNGNHDNNNKSTDAATTSTKETTGDCVPSSNFFHHNLHLEDHMIHIRPVC